MKAELRQVKASMYAGITDIVFGVFAWLTGFADWYFIHFHFFGILGIGMIFYAVWLYYFYSIDTMEKHVLKDVIKRYP